MKVLYRICLKKAKLKPLKERRDDLTRKFALRVFVNPKFSARWFPPREDITYGLRRREKIEEIHSKTTRLRRAPIHHMRKILNAEASFLTGAASRSCYLDNKCLRK